MSTFNGLSFQDPRNINLKGSPNRGSGVVRFSQQGVSNWGTNPFSTTDAGIYINAAGNLVYSYLGTATVIGAAGGGGVIPTWLQIFNANNTFALAGTTWTIDNTTSNNNVLTLTNSGAGSGHVVQITNVGTGKDINGTSGLWSVDKSGNAVFAQVTTPILTSAANLLISASGAGVITIGANTNTITLAKAVTFSAGATLANLILGTTSNTVADLIETNNTATTIGAGVSSLGLAVIRSTSLTTGNALLVQLAEGTLTTGYYFNAWDSVGVASVFKIGSKGQTTIAGSAYGTAALTLTAGDLNVSAGAINHIAVGATTANGFTGTYNGLTTGIGMSLIHTTSVITTGSVFSVSSTSIDTGTAQGTLVNLVSSASTAGTIVQLTVNALTTGVAFLVSGSAAYTGTGFFGITQSGATTGSVAVITANALTTGHAFTVTSSGVITTTGDLVSVIGNSATTSTGLVRISATGMTTGTTVSITGGGANMTAAGIVVSIAPGANIVGIAEQILSTGVYTGTGLWVLTANSATTGTIGTISGTGLTSGIGLLVTGGGVNMLTAGIALSVAMGAATTGAGLSVVTTGVYTGSGALLLTANSATTGTLAVVSGTGLTTGIGIKVVATAATLTTGFYFAANDGAVNVLTIGANGHITSNQTTAPTIAVTTQNGITAAAVTAGSSDGAGQFTTTGTSTGSTVITITFNKTFTVAPKTVDVMPTNASAAAPNSQAYAPVANITATSFQVLIPPGGTYAATPSYAWNVIA